MQWRILSVIAVLGALSLVGGCLPDLGQCDESAARAVVYTDDAEGLPAYGGQALVHRSCGAGVFCHSEAARGAMRNGAPIDMNFDLALSEDADSTELLRRGQSSVFDLRQQIMGTIEGETMPPGEVGLAIRDMGPRYRELPEIDTPEGEAILRNWLACDAPVVERVREDRPDGIAPVGDVVPAMPSGG